MYKVYRKTGDIRVAFESAMKCRPPTGEQVEIPEQGGNVSAEPVAPVEAIPQEVPATAMAEEGRNVSPHLEELNPNGIPATTSRTKRALRPIVRALFRLAKPVLKPVAFRFRRFLIDGLRQEVLPLANELRGEVKLVNSELSDLIISSNASAISEFLKEKSEVNRGILNILAKLNRIDEYNLFNRSEIASMYADMQHKFDIFEKKQECINVNPEIIIDGLEKISMRLDRSEEGHSLGRGEVSGLLTDILGRYALIERNLEKNQEDDRLAISEIPKIFMRLDKIEGDSAQGRNEVAKLRADVLGRYTSSERQLRTALSDAKSLISEILHIFPKLDRIEEYSLAGARRVAVNCGPDDTVINTMVGYVLCASTDSALVALLLDGGELERGTRLLIERLLSPGDVFIDVGANIGLHTLAAARAMKGVGKIIAFEPYGPTMRRLKTTLWFNGFLPMVDLHQSAASNRFEVSKLYLGATSGHHSLFPLDTQESPGGDPVDVRLVTLDGTIESGERVDLLKIDAEGAELDVLQGAMATIESNPEIGLIVEFGPSHVKRTGHNEEAWMSAFADLGFVFRAIHPLTGILEDIPFESLKAMESVNLFFARPHSSAWQKAQS